MKNTRYTYGFTIVELLIVIVVIGILAAVTIVGYNGIVDRSKVSVVKNELGQAIKVIENLRTVAADDSYPADLSAANLSTSSGVTYQYTVDNSSNPKSFCLTATLSTINYYISSTSGGPVSGVCSGHVSASPPPPNGGVVTTVATSAQGINDPRGIVADSSGNIFVNNSGTRQIYKITPGGVVSVFAGSGTNASVDGTGTGASIYTPGGLSIDSSGNIYLGECNGHKIRKISPTAVVTTLAGSTFGYQDGTGSGARFFCPQGTAVDSAGNVYVADGSNHRIRKVTAAGVVTTLAGSGVAGYADGTGTAAQFNNPVGIAVDSSGNVYVNDDTSSRVRKITPAGVVTTFVGSGVAGFANGTGTAAQVNTSRAGLTVDSGNTIYLADGLNNRIRKITSAGVVTTLAGSGTAGTLDGTGVAAQFSYPRNIFIDASGIIYVNDNSTNRIRKIQ